MPVWNSDDVDKFLAVRKQKKRHKSVTKMEAIVKDAKEFSSATTIHGISYLASPDHSIGSKLFWMVTVILAILGTSYQVFSMWWLWGELPVITTLDTISYPIEKLEFPAVTLCPQGSVLEIMDTVFYYQFEKWIIRKTEEDASSRNKRNTDNSNGHLSSFLNSLTNASVVDLLNEFMNETYPGANDIPTKFAAFLSSDDPDKMIESNAILMPENESPCDEKENQEFLDQVKQNLGEECPERFKNLNSTTCILLADAKMTYDAASSYCRDKGATILFLDSWDEIEELLKLDFFVTSGRKRRSISEMSLAARNTNGQDVFQAIEASEEKAIEIAAEATPLGQRDWLGPFSKVWFQRYTDTCDFEVEYQNVTVEECKQICKNGHVCNVIVFRNKKKRSGRTITSCLVRKCPLPTPPPNRIPTSNHNASYYLTESTEQLPISEEPNTTFGSTDPANTTQEPETIYQTSTFPASKSTTTISTTEEISVSSNPRTEDPKSNELDLWLSAKDDKSTLLRNFESNKHGGKFNVDPDLGKRLQNSNQCLGIISFNKERDKIATLTSWPCDEKKRFLCSLDKAKSTSTVPRAKLPCIPSKTSSNTVRNKRSHENLTRSDDNNDYDFHEYLLIKNVTVANENYNRIFNNITVLDCKKNCSNKRTCKFLVYDKEKRQCFTFSRNKEDKMFKDLRLEPNKGYVFYKKIKGQRNWMGPLSKVWTQKYTDSCDVEVEYQNVTVEECKQICENRFRCNVLVFRNEIKKSGQKYTSCNVRKCPVPIPPPSINPNPNHNASFYLAVETTSSSKATTIASTTTNVGSGDEQDIDDEQEQNDVRNNDEDNEENDDEEDTNVNDEEGEKREVIDDGRENMELEDNDQDESDIQEKRDQEEKGGTSYEEKDVDNNNEKNEAESLGQDSQASKRKATQKPINIQRLETSLDPSKEHERKDKIKQAMREYHQKFGNLDFEKVYQPMFDLLWYTQLPCNDVKGWTSNVKDELSFIKRCYWKESPIACSAVFRKQPTDRGMCCSFNIDEAEKLLRPSKYTKVISERQRHDSEYGFESSKKPPWFLKNNEPIPRVGVENGLTLIFDAHSHRLSKSSVTDNFLGVPVLIEHKDKFPLVKRSGVNAMPGFETRITVNAFDVQAKQEIRRFGAAKRRCYFPDEYELKIHKNYSHPSCIFECKIEFAAKCLSTCMGLDESGFERKCDCSDNDLINEIDLKFSNSCVPWFYPRNDHDTNKFCDPWATKKFNRIFNRQVPPDQCNHCLDDCSSTVYESMASYSKLPGCDSINAGSFLCGIKSGGINPPPWIMDAQNEFLNANQRVPEYLNTDLTHKIEENGKFSSQRFRYPDGNVDDDEIFAAQVKMNPHYNAFEKDIGIVNVFFAKEHVPKYVKANRWSIFDFLSQIGGSLGLFMGISAISVAEILYWLIFRLLGKLLSPN